MHYDGTLPIEKRDDNEYELSFRNVSFCYPGTADDILEKCQSGNFKIGQENGTCRYERSRKDDTHQAAFTAL